MSSIDKRYFLHFLDRELLEIHGVYNNCIEKSIIRDMRIILTCSTNTLIIPSAFLFESKFAECIRKEFGIFFANGKIAVSLSYASIKHMIDIKREQFKGYEKDFPNYFDNVPDFYQEGKLLLYPKKSNTTVYIADRMIKSLSNQTVDIKSTVIPYVIDAIGTRENKAITHHLFLRLYERLEFENKEKLVINNLITESYIKSYLEYYNASIFIGLTTGIYQFDSLDNNSPFSNILFWIQLYQKTGLFSFIDSSEVTVINQIINSSEHEEFLKTVEEFVTAYYKTRSIVLSGVFFECVDLLKKRNSLKPNRINEYYNRLIEVEDEINGLIQTNFKKERIFMHQDEVFVVHGRNERIKNSLFDFLRAVGIRPLEWEEVVSRLSSGSPTTLEIVSEGLKNTSATIVLFTGDDLAHLKNNLCRMESEKKEESQPRPNVLLEAGMSIALNKNKTVIVRIGNCRRISDLDGINFITLDNSSESRNAFVSRLNAMGLSVSKTGNRWLNIGDFNE